MRVWPYLLMLVTELTTAKAAADPSILGATRAEATISSSTSSHGPMETDELGIRDIVVVSAVRPRRRTHRSRFVPPAR